VTEPQIADEIYTAMERLGAEKELLAIVGSWRDTLPVREVLAVLRRYNATGKALRPFRDAVTTLPHRGTDSALCRALDRHPALGPIHLRRPSRPGRFPKYPKTYPL
jgi:hypothetical protein